MVSAPRCRPGARGLLMLLLLLPLPGTRGQCGTPPTLSRAVPHDTTRTEGFPIDTEVTYRCLDGFVKIPGQSDTLVCLSDSEWSTIGEFCGPSCGTIPRLKSAVLSKEDEKKNYHAHGTTVSYVCRPGYERTELRPVITCLENFTWSEAPEFCRGKSCGVPIGPEHGRAVDITNDLYGARVNIICDEGFRLHGRPFIQCILKGHQVEWSQLPTCQAITCSPPPNIANGMHNGSNVEIFDYNSSVTYKCDDNFSLTGEASIHCTTRDNINGVWNGPAPECKGLCGALPTLSHAIPRDTSRTEGFPIGTEVTYRCLDGFAKIPGKSDTVVCLSNSEWSTIGEFCGRKSCGVPKGPEHGRAVVITNDLYGARVNIICDEGIHVGTYSRNDPTGSLTGRKNPFSKVLDYYRSNWRVRFRLRGRTFIQCMLKGDQVEWSQLPTCEVIITQDKPTTVPPKGTEVAGTSSVIIAQDKPTTVPPEGAEVTGTSSGSALNTAGNSAEPEGEGPGIGIGIGGGIIVSVSAAVVVYSLKYQKKKGSYSVNPDSPKCQITT